MHVQRNLRRRLFFAVEGESEKSFIAWLQDLANEQALYVYLDRHSLGGGGYEVMLNETRRLISRKQKEGRKYEFVFLLVDEDRSTSRSDEWSIEKLKEEASKYKIIVCSQRPNFEGLLLKMLRPGKESEILSASVVKIKFPRAWPEYEKPVDKQTLAKKLSLNDLIRAAQFEPDLKILLTKIGFSTTPNIVKEEAGPFYQTIETQSNLEAIRPLTSI